MTATSFASSRLMFNPPSTSTAGPSPAFNPFAPTAADTKANPFARTDSGDPVRGVLERSVSPFSATNANKNSSPAANPFAPNPKLSSSNTASNLTKSTAKAGKSSGTAFPQGPAFSKAQPPRKSKPQDVESNGFSAFKQPKRRGSSSSNHSSDGEGYLYRRSSDPHAIKVYSQLRKDGIRPPKWPSRPGDPANKAEMGKFRETYEQYRDQVRASLTRAKLIDDPNERKKLSDALDFRGICEDMCPDFEKITRIAESDIYPPEKNPKTKYPDARRMIKRLARSAAGQEAPLPMDVRSVPCLQRTLDYLIDEVLVEDDKLQTLHGFLWDRTRAIRRDFTFFSTLSIEELKGQIYCLENIARFHVTAYHLISRQGKKPENFSDQQEMEQLGKALLSLRDLYDDCLAQGVSCDNEAEFRAYYLLFHAKDPSILEKLQRQWRPSLWTDFDIIRTAVSLVEAFQSTQSFHGPLAEGPALAASSSYNAYFRIVSSPEISYTMACFAELHFPELRRSILAAMKSGMSRPKGPTQDITVDTLNKFLRFDTMEEATEFAELHEIQVGSSSDESGAQGDQLVMLEGRGALPRPRLKHQFSETIVEKKRSSRSLPTVIHGTVFEDTSKRTQPQNTNEGSLFVQDDAPPSSSKPTTAAPATFQSSSTTDTFSPFSRSSGLKSTADASGQSAAAASPFQNAFAPKVDSATSTAQQSVSSLQGSGANKSAVSTLEPKPLINGPSQVDANPFAGVSNPKSLPAFAPQGDAALQPASLSPQPPTMHSSILNGQPSSQTPSISFTGPGATSSGASPLTGQPAPTSSQSSQPTSENAGPSTFAPFAATDSKQKDASPRAASSLEHQKSVVESPSLSSSTTQVQSPSLLPSTSHTLQTSSANTTQSTKPSGPSLSAPRNEPPPPKRDLFKDFTSWYVLADQGLMEEFQTYMVEDILKEVYDTFVVQQEEARRIAEEKRDLEKASSFRAYNVSLRYFYLWKDNARKRRLRALRLQQKQQMKQHMEEQRQAQKRAHEEEARKEKAETAKAALRSRTDELVEVMKQSHVKKQKPEDARQATGEPSSLCRSRNTPSHTMQNVSPARGRSPTPLQSSLRRSASRQSSQTRSISSSFSRGASKTSALMDEFSVEQQSGFRRSLPPQAVHERGRSKGPMMVSERWRLKAMGIVQMPDGTAMPESLANEVRYGGRIIPGSGRGRSETRRASLSGSLPKSNSRAMMPPPPPVAAAKDGISLGSASPNKRKRSTGDFEEGGTEASARASSNPPSHKRVMSEAESIIQELRAMRVEMEEGTTWFRSQNERLQSEVGSRGTTPWDE